MLNLQSTSSDRWLDQVRGNVPELLIDHAHCEKKAASTAMSLIFAYVEHVELVRVLSDIVSEELEHFKLVLDVLERRGIEFRRLRPSSYGARLAELVRGAEPGRAVDRLLIAGLIEARSCERFARLRDGLDDPELSEFFGSLFESEARHHSTYVRLAKLFAPDDEVHARLDELATAEAEIIAQGDSIARVHS
ncbi:MAG: tRNA-(ms[2]io[6]A)-hydroxylase [Pirellulales bacterium]|nr:tRNA-(ms[2]io[6]A)-hydroxylase [Pirellulales bacterium]